MSICDIDLDIENYNYTELLDLLSLRHDFDEADLKRAKKMVLMTHPDKSKYDKDIFLFMAKVYKLIYQVYITTNKITTLSINNSDIDYDGDVSNIIKDYNSNDFKEQLNTFSKSKNFNSEFNKLFEKYKLSSEEDDSGYENWLKENTEYSVAKNKNEMNEYIENKKQHLSSLIVYKEPDELNNNSINSSNLINKKPEYYESNVFDKLRYDDVKKVYTETVIPVTYDDYKNKQKFNSIGEYKTYRNKDLCDLKYNTKQDSRKHITETERAYQLVKQDRLIRENYTNIQSNFLRIKN